MLTWGAITGLLLLSSCLGARIYRDQLPELDVIPASRDPAKGCRMINRILSTVRANQHGKRDQIPRISNKGLGLDPGEGARQQVGDFSDRVDRGDRGIELLPGKGGYYIIDGGSMSRLGTKRQNFISDGGMMMGLGKRSLKPKVGETGMMMGLGKRSLKIRRDVGETGMLMGLGKRGKWSNSGGLWVVGRSPTSSPWRKKYRKYYLYFDSPGPKMGLGKGTLLKSATVSDEGLQLGPGPHYISDGGMMMGLGKKRRLGSKWFHPVPTLSIY